MEIWLVTAEVSFNLHFVLSLANPNQALLSKLTQRNSNLIVLAVLTTSGR